MKPERIDVIATTISGSIQDWKKVERIVPLFREEGLEDVRLHVTASHAEARETARAVLEEGCRIPISAGGSGTFRSVLEGCIDSGLPLQEIRLGFLRKGSADLIGKTLGMPDEIEQAVAVFASAIRSGDTIDCDVLSAESVEVNCPPQHFVGYGGAEIFGRIPYFTENRFMKWYKGVLSQVFGDLGPFTTGMTLALAEHVIRGPFRGRGTWRIQVDDGEIVKGRYHALIVVNGYLGPELAYSSDPLGSGRFHLFAMKDSGLRKLYDQVRRARNGTIMESPEQFGMETFVAERSLELTPSKTRIFPVNVDGSTLPCRHAVRFQLVDSIPLIANRS